MLHTLVLLHQCWIGLFYFQHSSHSLIFNGKPAVAIVSCRRNKSSATLDLINKYFTISNMSVVSSQYWNVTHGFSPDEIKNDHVRLQTMRTLGRNMAWLIKCIKYGKKDGIDFPELEPSIL